MVVLKRFFLQKDFQNFQKCFSHHMGFSIGCKTVICCLMTIVYHHATFSSSHEHNAPFCDNNSIRFL